ncbi:hypothetical protein GQ53DRAFT_822086 [Thozetella sp. PMI_491]|nr:hypothetical protein GQ53DRAFT_822086 [Thozetella sp. PMI_491]
MAKATEDTTARQPVATSEDDIGEQTNTADETIESNTAMQGTPYPSNQEIFYFPLMKMSEVVTSRQLAQIGQMYCDIADAMMFDAHTADLIPFHIPRISIPEGMTYEQLAQIAQMHHNIADAMQIAANTSDLEGAPVSSNPGSFGTHAIRLPEGMAPNTVAMVIYFFHYIGDAFELEADTIYLEGL